MFSITEILWIIQWWGVFCVVGIIFLPLTENIFSSFIDRGYLFSKVLGIALISYTILVVNVLHILPFGLMSLLLIIWLFTLLNFWLFRKRKNNRIFLPWKFFVFQEILFLVGILFWSFIRAHEPSINGLEKFMDYGFINSILRTSFQPAVDMWFPPYPINYYYFGHLTTAVLTKLSHLPSSVTYNLMIATIFSFTLSLSISLGMNLLSKITTLKKSLIGGVLTGLIVALSGNLHTIYAFFRAYEVDNPVPFWNLDFLLNTFPNAYWYPNATRFIPFTIHEFPLYSFVVSDLHGHVVNIIFVLLTIALLFSLFLKKPLTISYKLLILLALLLSIMYMTNAWDGLIYMMLTSFVFVFLRKPKAIVPLFFLFLFFSIPFNINFRPFAHGVGIICAGEFFQNIGKIGPFLFEKDHCQRSAWWQLLTLYGFFYFFVSSFILFAFTQRKKIKIQPTDIFVLLLILASTILIIIPELVYLKDIYPAHYRANTMFKLVYQSFIMLSISTGYIIIRLSSSLKPKGLKIFNIYYVYSMFSILFLILVFIYPYFATKSYYGDLKNYSGLDGIAYMKQRLSDDYEAVNWINQNITGKPVIVEAQGDSYTDYARISANTGLPTILGWTVHEWLWRGSYDIPSPRIEEVRLIYESNDLTETKKILKKHHAEYIYVGNLEREKYTKLIESKFEKLGNIVLEVGQTKIYKLEDR